MNLFPRTKQDRSAAYTKVMLATCYFLLALGVAALGYVGYVSADSKAFQAVEKENSRKRSFLKFLACCGKAT